jgi:hypothetical protein
LKEGRCSSLHGPIPAIRHFATRHYDRWNLGKAVGFFTDPTTNPFRTGAPNQVSSLATVAERASAANETSYPFARRSKLSPFRIAGSSSIIGVFWLRILSAIPEKD